MFCTVSWVDSSFKFKQLNLKGDLLTHACEITSTFSSSSTKNNDCPPEHQKLPCRGNILSIRRTKEDFGESLVLLHACGACTPQQSRQTQVWVLPFWGTYPESALTASWKFSALSLSNSIWTWAFLAFSEEQASRSLLSAISTKVKIDFISKLQK